MVNLFSGQSKMESQKKSVPLSKLAHPGKRFQAQFIDGLIAYALGICAFYLFDSFLSREFSFYAGLAIALVYFLFSDALPNGQSLGKKLLKIQVLDDDGIGVCSLAQSFFRNITFPLGVIDWVFIFFKSHRRLGDFVAGTIVINM